MKPSEIVATATDEGLEALGTKLTNKVNVLVDSISVNLEGSDIGGGMGIGKAFKGLLEHMIVSNVREGK